MKKYIFTKDELSELGIENPSHHNLAITAKTIGDIVKEAHDRGEISDEEFDMIPKIVDENYEKFAPKKTSNEDFICIITTARLLADIQDEEI